MRASERSARNYIRQQLGIDYVSVVVGSATGVIEDERIPGNVNVRIKASNGFMFPFSVGAPKNKMPLQVGDDVELTYSRKKLRIGSIDPDGLLAKGGNPIAKLTDTEFFRQQFLATLNVTQTQTASTTIKVKAWNPIADKYYEGADWELDLGSGGANLIPSAGNMRYAVVCVKNDFSGIQAYGSTTRSQSDVDLNIDDVNEAIGLSTGIPFWAIPLSNNQSSITQNDIIAGRDLRQLLNVQLSAYLATSDATTTDIVTVSVAELTAITITGEFAGTKTDYSASIGGVFSATFRRASGGNVTLVGSANVTSNEDSSGTPTLTLAADTGNQTADIRVTGIAAENWKWRVNYKVVKI